MCGAAEDNGNEILEDSGAFGDSDNQSSYLIIATIFWLLQKKDLLNEFIWAFSQSSPKRYLTVPIVFYAIKIHLLVYYSQILRT